MFKLKKILTNNFKSYQGNHEIGEFNDHFTAIVGPNGCGKSNIIDSIMFVLGYNAKKMRHAIIKDLIYKGEAEASVELLFVNENNTSISLLRSILKSGATKYFIRAEDNKSFTNLKEKEFGEFVKVKLGLDTTFSRFLILQGEIESIALMNPIELLNYIEDCIGSNVYREQIADSEKKEVILGEEIEKTQDQYKFLENEYNFKKEQLNAYMDTLKQKYSVLKNMCEIDDLKVELNLKEIKELEDKIVKTEKELVDLNLEKNKLMQLVKKQKVSKSKALISLEKEYTDEKIKMTREENNKNKAIDEIKRISKKLNEIEEYEEQQVSIEKNNKIIQQNRLEIEKQEKILKDKQEILNRFNKNNKNTKRDELVNDLVKLNNLIDNDVKTKEEQAYLINKIKKYKTDLEGAKNINVVELDKEINKIEKDINLTKIELNKRKRNVSENKMWDDIYKKEQLVINAIKEMEGFVGQLKDLGQIESDYELAVEASTSQLKSIVVKTTKNAEEMIKIITGKKLQRTTFIILDKLRDTKITTNNTDKLLLNKINTDYISCFKYALGDTLVADNLEDAKKLAFGAKRERVVTKDGKLLEKSGIMSGGQTSRKIKPIGEIEKALSRMNVLYEEKIKIRSEIKSIEHKKRELINLQKELDKINSSNKNSTQLDQTISKIDQIKKQIDEIDQRNKIPKEIEIVKSEVKEIIETIKTIKNKNRELNTKRVSTAVVNVFDKNLFINQLERLQNSVVELDYTKLNELEEQYQTQYDEYKLNLEEYSKTNKKLDEILNTEAQTQVEKDNHKKELSVKNSYKIQISNRCGAYSKELKSIEQLMLIADNETVENVTNASVVIDKTQPDYKKMSIKKLTELIKSKEHAIKDKRVDDLNLSVKNTIVSEHKACKDKFDHIKNISEKQIKERDNMIQEIKELKKNRLARFMSGFDDINKNIKQIFSTLTFGGNAELELVNFLDPFTEGIQLQIMPRKKAWKAIGNLSGGEKTLSSLSLIFALHQFKPSPFYIMDEIDAALDYKNVSLISSYLKTINSQFIIISLRNDMFEIAQTLIGVYKSNDKSKTIQLEISK